MGSLNNPAVGVAIRHARSTVTFSNTSGTVTVFTITGRTLITTLTAYCTTSVIENGAVDTIELGGATDLNAFIVQTNPSLITANKWWADATPVGGVKQMDAIQIDVMTDENLILTIVGGTDLNSGTIVFDIWYLPITDSGALA